MVGDAEYGCASEAGSCFNDYCEISECFECDADNCNTPAPTIAPTMTTGTAGTTGDTTIASSASRASATVISVLLVLSVASAF